MPCLSIRPSRTYPNAAPDIQRATDLPRLRLCIQSNIYLAREIGSETVNLRNSLNLRLLQIYRTSKIQDYYYRVALNFI